MPSGLQNNIPDIFLKINVLTVISRKMFHVFIWMRAANTE